MVLIGPRNQVGINVHIRQGAAKLLGALRNSRSKFLTIISVLSVILFIAGCNKEQPAADTPPAPVAPRKISALGRIEPESEIRKVAVPGAVAGDRIENILVKENEYVKKGQPLATLNSQETLKAAYDESIQLVAVAQSKLDQVKAGAKESEVKAQEFRVGAFQSRLDSEKKAQDEIVERERYQMEESKRQWDRFKKLCEEGAVSASEADRYYVSYKTHEKNLQEAIDKREGKIKSLEALVASNEQTKQKIAEIRPVDVKLAESELNKAKAGRNKAQKELSFATVLSPQDGQILKIIARPGDKVSDEGILEMADTDNMIVIAEVYQTDVPHIKIGQKANITADGFEKEVVGTVYEVGSQVTKQTIFSGEAGENQDLRVVEVKLRLNAKDIKSGVNKASNLQVNVVFEPSEEKPG